AAYCGHLAVPRKDFDCLDIRKMLTTPQGQLIAPRSGYRYAGFDGQTVDEHLSPYRGSELDGITALGALERTAQRSVTAVVLVGHDESLCRAHSPCPGRHHQTESSRKQYR